MSKKYPQWDPYDADIRNFGRNMEKKREVLRRNEAGFRYLIIKIILAILLGAMLIATCAGS